MSTIPEHSRANGLSAWLFEWSPLWVRAISVAAVFFLAAATYYLGGRHPSWTHLFYLPILLGAANLGYPGALLSVLASGLVIGPILPPFTEVGTIDPTSMWATRVFFYFLVGGTSAVMFQTARNGYLWARELSLGLGEERDRSLKRVQELESIQELDRVIMGSGELQHMLMVVLQTLSRLQKATTAAYWHFDEENGLLIREASVGSICLEVANEYLSKMSGVQLGEMTVGWAVLQRAVSMTRDVRTDPRYARFPDIAERLGHYSSIAAPVENKGKVVGALSVAFGEPRDFSEDDTRIVSMLANQMAIGLQSMEQRQQLRDLATQAISALGETVEARDPYTGDHCQRIADYSVAVAQELGLSPQAQERLRLAGYLHDVGKVGVSDAVLKKPGPLTPQEYAEIKQHPYFGSQLVKRMPMLSEIAPIVYSHHERYDGGGYPDGIKGERIPIEARIIAVVDAYDAMTNNRPYREALPEEAARQELIQGKGTQFDPELVDVFLRVMERGSVGSGGGTSPLT